MRTCDFDYSRNNNQDRTDLNYLPIFRFADLILGISALLLESGAHCGRISRNVQRVAKNTCYNVEIFITFTAVSVTVSEKENPIKTITLNKQVRSHGVHYGILTNTSILTWELFDNKISFDEFEKNISKLNTITKHNLWLVRTFIGIACACLCILAGGNWVDGAFAFIAAFTGLIVKQVMTKKRFNLMVTIACVAFITTSISGVNVLCHLGESPESSIATSVLYLIPGVPLINSIIDLMEGYIPTGIARGVFGGFILLCIAIGLFLSMTLIGINNF